MVGLRPTALANDWMMCLVPSLQYSWLKNQWHLYAPAGCSFERWRRVMTYTYYDAHALLERLEHPRLLSADPVVRDHFDAAGNPTGRFEVDPVEQLVREEAFLREQVPLDTERSRRLAQIAEEVSRRYGVPWRNPRGRS